MGKLFLKATERQSLRLAWYRIRANGIRSPLPETRDAVESFARDAERHISRIQKKLRDEVFSFDPQTGVLKKKKSGSKRGIVMAPIHNRIVERAWLDCLQGRVPFVQEVINTPTSVGGVPDRSVPHGLALIRDAMESGKKYFVRSDISGFFDNIPRQDVIGTLAQHIDDKKFLGVLDAATTVTLVNEHALGEDRRAFPTDEEGVAQGSPLSPLFGNILLHRFDQEFNEGGMVCVRFIDDFLLFGEDQGETHRAFNRANKHLRGLGLVCHDPFESGTAKGKAERGTVDAGFVFLGYDIRPGLFQPSKEARDKLKVTVDKHIQRGRHAVMGVIRAANSFEHRQRYVQTLDLLDRVIRGWGDSFAYADANSTINDLDRQIEDKIDHFRSWYRRKMRQADWRTKRRTGGVCLLEDIEPKSLDALPFRLGTAKRYRQTKDMIVISTDGSVIGAGPRAGRDKGPGGWGAVFHNDGQEISGHAHQVTNNQMELMAVIEAVKRTPVRCRVKIRTDSQYVYRAVQEGTMIRSNHDLWDVFRELSNQRRVDVVWVQGHAGDPHNERADALAQARSRHAQRSSRENGKEAMKGQGVLRR